MSSDSKITSQTRLRMEGGAEEGARIRRAPLLGFMGINQRAGGGAAEGGRGRRVPVGWPKQGGLPYCHKPLLSPPWLRPNRIAGSLQASAHIPHSPGCLHTASIAPSEESEKCNILLRLCFAVGAACNAVWICLSSSTGWPDGHNMKEINSYLPSLPSSLRPLQLSLIPFKNI